MEIPSIEAIVDAGKSMGCSKDGDPGDAVDSPDSALAAELNIDLESISSSGMTLAEVDAFCDQHGAEMSDVAGAYEAGESDENEFSGSFYYGAEESQTRDASFEYSDGEWHASDPAYEGSQESSFSDGSDGPSHASHSGEADDVGEADDAGEFSNSYYFGPEEFHTRDASFENSDDEWRDSDPAGETDDLGQVDDGGSGGGGSGDGDSGDGGSGDGGSGDGDSDGNDNSKDVDDNAVAAQSWAEDKMGEKNWDQPVSVIKTDPEYIGAFESTSSRLQETNLPVILGHSFAGDQDPVFDKVNELMKNFFGVPEEAWYAHVAHMVKASILQTLEAYHDEYGIRNWSHLQNIAFIDACIEMEKTFIFCSDHIVEDSITERELQRVKSSGKYEEENVEIDGSKFRIFSRI